MYPVATVLLMLTLLESWIVWQDIPRWVIPRPSSVVSSIVTDFGKLLPHAFVTTKVALVGFALSVAIALPLAVVLDASRRLELAAYPLMVASQVVPVVAVAPLLIVWFGFGLLPKALTVFIMSFFPLLIHGIVGLRSIERNQVLLASSMGAGRVKRLVHFKIPGALPNIFAGLKLGITYALIGAVIAEFVAANAGLGWVVLVSHGRLNMLELFTAVSYLALIGFILFATVHIAERRAIPWHRGFEHTERTI